MPNYNTYNGSVDGDADKVLFVVCEHLAHHRRDPWEHVHVVDECDGHPARSREDLTASWQQRHSQTVFVQGVATALLHQVLAKSVDGWLMQLEAESERFRLRLVGNMDHMRQAKIQ